MFSFLWRDQEIAIHEEFPVTTAKRKILFLNHSASRNGASILLLHLLQWLEQNSDFSLEVLSYGSGPLIEEFRTVAQTHIWPGPMSRLQVAPPRPLAWLRPQQLEAKLLNLFLRRHRYDLVYANTAATWNHVRAL